MKHGIIATAYVSRKQQNGYLVEVEGAALELPAAQAVRSLSAGEHTDIFIYTDKKGQPAATMHLPEVTANTYGWAAAAEVVPELGVFVDLNLPHDILVPKDDLPFMKNVWPEAGDHLYVILSTDKQGRLLARTAGEETMLETAAPAPESLINHNLTGWVYRAGKAGSFIRTENGHRAFLHPTQRMKEPRMGERVEVRVVDVKEDGTINVSMFPAAAESMDKDAHAIMLHLSRNRGEIPFSDKSSPEDIQNTFQISKAAFKRAVGQLLKQGLIEQTDQGTIRTKE
ncbi:CvfB family protein [Salibacterium lacus]|uniref:S1 RNA-binding domain-containing protein n=1 Tax=Salibacterium lacus TaxID=1898109 RepID=A0ABW5SZN2_9BACI